MAALAGFSATIQITGASTSAATQGLSLVSGKTYRMTDSAYEVLDPDTALVIDDAGRPVSTTVDASEIESINYLHGEVTFDSGYSPGGAITIGSGNYLPLTTISTAKSGSFTVRQDALDSSALDGSAIMRARTIGLIDAEGTMSLLDPDLGTTVGGGDTLMDLLIEDATKTFVVEYNPGSGDVFRAFARVSGLDMSTSVEDLDMSTLNWQLAAKTSQESYEVGCAWG